MMQESSPYAYSTDIEEANKRHDVTQEALKVMGDLIDGASRGLEELEDNHMLGSAIVRKCQELADVIGDLSKQMQNKDEQRALAQACLKDGVLMEHGGEEELTETDMMNALSGAASLLEDVEAALRSVGQDEADEIADAALIASRLFISLLQSSYHTLLAPPPPLQESDRIEMLDDEDEAKTEYTSRSTTRSADPRFKSNRVRALWPPLGPAVASVLQWSKDAALQQPIMAVALGLTMWPAAIVTAFVGTPILITDGLIQHVYDNAQDGPLVQTLEYGATQVVQSAKVALLCTGLVFRQANRVAKRQLDRHGGVENVTKEAFGFCIDRVTHPVDTVCQSVQGISWGFGVVRDAALYVHQLASQEMEKEMDKTCQTLQ